MGETKSIQVLLDTDLWARVRSKAALLKRSAASAVEEALTAWVGSDAQRFREMPGGTYRPGETFRIGPPLEVETGSVAEKNESAARALDPLNGLPEAIGTEDFPLTHRTEYLGQDRSMSPAVGRSYKAGETPVLTMPPVGIARAPETPCGRCRVPWKNHQEGLRKNRAGTTGCTTFEDPT